MLPRRRPRGSLHDGISLNFATGRYYTKAQGGPANIQPLTSLFTFTGGNQSMYMGPAGLLVASATNTPRIEYDANGNCLGLLMEAARTNLCLQSQDLTTTWADVNTVVITANSTTAPDGTLTADTITDNGAGSIKGKQQTFVVADDSLDHTASVFILKTSGGTSPTSKFSVLLTGGTPVSTNAYINTDTGVVGSGTATVKDHGLYWRVSAKATNNSTGNTALAIQYYPAVNTHGLYTDNIVAQGSSVVWGFQLEKASFASSYIPATTVAVSRTADSCIRTLGSEFSATAGTVVVAGRASGGQDAAQQFVYEFGDGTGNESTRLQRQANTDLCRVNVVDGGAAQSGGLTDFTFVNSTAFKHALAWSVNDLAASLNGAAVTTDAVATIPTTTSLALGLSTFGAPANGHILRFDYWPERKANAFLVSAST